MNSFKSDATRGVNEVLLEMRLGFYSEVFFWNFRYAALLKNQKTKYFITVFYKCFPDVVGNTSFSVVLLSEECFCPAGSFQGGWRVWIISVRTEILCPGGLKTDFDFCNYLG